ncbi:MAG: outer membrane beta-barrel protein [Bacteroidales bacterium]|nr:outer membrane beta-barrel protein [Bacteroidales bacterium]
MTTHNDKWTDALRESLTGYSEQAPEGLWDAISSGLAARRRRRRILAIWSASITTAAAAAIALFVFITPSTPSPSPLSTAEALETDSPTPSSLASVEEPKHDIPSPSSLALAEEPKHDAPTPSSLASAEDLKNDRTIAEIADDIYNRGFTADNKNVYTGNSQVSSAGEQYFITDTPTSTNKHNRPRINITLSSSASGSSSSTAAGTPPPHPAKNLLSTKSYDVIPGTYMSDALNGPGQSQNYLELLSRNTESKKESSHNIPLRFGAGIQLSFGNRWSAETGLYLTLLKSRFYEGVDMLHTTSTQELTYLGIPLFVSYNVYTTHNTTFYLSAGPMYEKLIHGEINSHRKHHDKEISTNTESLPLDDRRWSLNLNAGACYALSRRSALYIQPGLSYYPQNKKEINSRYTSSPLTVSITFGYRFATE